LANLTGTERARYVQSMFTQIARRYDLMNRVMTAGQDVSWRRIAIRRAGLPPAGRLLDLGAGTGDLAATARQAVPGCQVVAADFTL
jgi:demethylmenaquinone methyltransferase / 2-methoxy-6-polyprenyl-1,4-benzoquinol methylase